LCNDNVDTETADRKVVSSCVSGQGNEMFMNVCEGDHSLEVKVEADSNDITEHPHDDKPRPYLSTVCDKRLAVKTNLNDHELMHIQGAANKSNPLPCFVNISTTNLNFYKKIYVAISHSYLHIIAKVMALEPRQPHVL